MFVSEVVVGGKSLANLNAKSSTQPGNFSNGVGAVHAMIDKVIKFLEDEITERLIVRGKFQAGSPKIVEAMPPSWHEPADSNTRSEKLRVSLVNLQEESVLKNHKNYVVGNNERIERMNPELRLNLFVLVSADFTDYGDSLGYLSDVIGLFQSKNVFTPENAPGLDTAIQKLIVRMVSMDLQEQNHLWSVIGSRYMPSAVYKIETVFIQESIVGAEEKPVMEVFLRKGHG